MLQYLTCTLNDTTELPGMSLLFPWRSGLLVGVCTHTEEDAQYVCVPSLRRRWFNLTQEGEPGESMFQGL